MKRFLVAVSVVLAAFAIADTAVSVPKFDGKFVWIKAPAAGMALTKGGAKSLSFDITFTKDVAFAKVTTGYQWFTFLVADQGADWKWNQGKSTGAVPIKNGSIKAGKYRVTIQLDGIPASVLKDKKQTISIGAGTSGLTKPIAFKLDGWKAN